MPKIRTLPSRVPAQGSRLATLQPGSWRSSKQSSTARGYGYKWQQARKQYLDEHPFCVTCLSRLGIRATDKAGIVVECATRGIQLPWANMVDHTIPHRGDLNLFWDRKNWAAMCTTHHSRDKQREEQSNG